MLPASLAAAGRDGAVLAPVALRHAVDAREEIEALIRALVAELRFADVSWAEIGAQLAVTKQAAQQRYGGAVDQLLREVIRATRHATLTASSDPAVEDVDPSSCPPATGWPVGPWWDPEPR